MTTDLEIYDTLLITTDSYGVIGVGLVRARINGRNYLIFGYPTGWIYLNAEGNRLSKRPAPTPQQFRHSWMRRNKLYIYPRKFEWWLNEGD